MSSEPYHGDNHLLILRLCSEAGSIMEFASAKAITIRGTDQTALLDKLDELIKQAENATLLLKSARALQTG
ncbi:hypothetical protein [Sphingorhabdus sp. Alg231-15]|uniref:hypothetical protein n=1 Tax=Sphingorhabdus sp. Alg231-15 TaxID=1922222 RepID=UPI000D54E477